MLNKKGMSYVKTAVIVIVLSMILSAVLAYASLMTIIQTTKDNTERVLDSFVMHNSTQIFNSIKQGNDFTAYFNKSIFLKQFDSELSLDFQNGLLYSVGDNGAIAFKMTVPTVKYTYNNTLNLNASYELQIPVEFAGNHLFDLKIPIIVKTSYNLKQG